MLEKLWACKVQKVVRDSKRYWLVLDQTASTGTGAYSEPVNAPGEADGVIIDQSFLITIFVIHGVVANAKPIAPRAYFRRSFLEVVCHVYLAVICHYVRLQNSLDMAIL